MTELIIAVVIGLILIQFVFKTLKFIAKLVIFLALVAAIYYFLGYFPILS